MIPYSRPKLSDFYTLSQTKLLENHTLHSGTYPYSLYMRVLPRGPRFEGLFNHFLCYQCEINITMFIVFVSIKLHFSVGRKSYFDHSS